MGGFAGQAHSANIDDMAVLEWWDESGVEKGARRVVLQSFCWTFCCIRNWHNGLARVVIRTREVPRGETGLQEFGDVWLTRGCLETWVVRDEGSHIVITSLLRSDIARSVDSKQSPANSLPFTFHRRLICDSSFVHASTRSRQFPEAETLGVYSYGYCGQHMFVAAE